MNDHVISTRSDSYCLSGHRVLSVTAIDEPDRQKKNARIDLQAALPTREACDAAGVTLSAIATTPDFHPGKPVPVGVVVDSLRGVLPHLIGNDIGCGMRMLALDGVAEEDLVPELESTLRHVFFQGGRDLALSGRHRHAILQDGLPGLIESLMPTDHVGLLRSINIDQAWQDLDSTTDMGRFDAGGLLADFKHYADIRLGSSHDSILGNIGGGNHFVEIGRVGKIIDGALARTAGVREGSIVIVVHSGSLDFGQRVGSIVRTALLRRKGLVSDYRIVSMDRDAELFERFRMGQANAVNVAFANRFFIGMQAIEAISRTLGRDIGSRLIYDAPHNVAWIKEEKVRHRKGACPAAGPGTVDSTRYRWHGEPVILPGSMGDGSWLLLGNGDKETLSSSAHGAGRRLSRQEARRQEASALSRLRVVGPVDLCDPMLKGRKDVLSEAMSRLKEEAPAAYRPIDSVVDAMVNAGMVRRGFRIEPLLTVKG